MLVDSFNRIHNYLRISITDNCNLRCFYCMPDEDHAVTASTNLMQVEEIDQIAKTFVSLGVTKIRLTGGEPLVRKDAAKIIEQLSRYPVELTLTTNGTRLHEFIPVLKNAGVRSVNVSLDTLDKDKFQVMTKRDAYQRVLSNIRQLSKENIHVKVNVVMMKGVNDDEINAFVAMTKALPVHIRFIEFMPFSGNHWESQKVFGWKQILEVVGEEYDYIKLKDDIHDTTKKYIVPDHVGTFAVISTITSPFCGNCNRMRITADGKMKNCLFSQKETDLLSALRRGEDIVPLIRHSIGSKAAERGGQFTGNIEELDTASLKNRSMITIGG
ncbi:GTP 3',8-cyclase MoaA [Aridibaculum aurantiacum]|uniref:GTP 3',8-cyclase MoaA n=1 Tax=Aridibaculum aurantiacum TaxID=2810307 RepID=UPI001A9601EF|nr:GTP 3',8-cyclase MoaA [Aridibaculum aurantiacum]